MTAVCVLCGGPVIVETWAADRIASLPEIGLVLTIPTDGFTIEFCAEEACMARHLRRTQKGDGVNRDEILALAWQAVTDRCVDPAWWLEWEDMPLLAGSDYELVLEAIYTVATALIEQSTADLPGVGFADVCLRAGYARFEPSDEGREV